MQDKGKIKLLSKKILQIIQNQNQRPKKIYPILLEKVI
jgi:hypothetical protein